MFLLYPFPLTLYPVPLFPSSPDLAPHAHYQRNVRQVGASGKRIVERDYVTRL